MTDYSDVGSSFQNFTASWVAVDSSDNIYVFATDYYNYTDGLRCYKFNSTLTYQSYWQVLTGAYGINSVEIDSSGNFFVVAGDGNLRKFNSSGTSQWTYHPHPSGSGYGNVKDVKIANSGKIYGCHNGNGSYIFRLTDNGGSYTEDWNVDRSSTGQTNKITVTSDQVICYPTSGSYDIFAVEETDGDVDTGFTSYDVGNEILMAYNDPLASVACGSFTTTAAIQYSRWVLRGGTITGCGPFETTDAVTVRGYGNALVDKIYVGGSYSYIGSPTPRYKWFGLNGEPPAEEYEISYPTSAATPNFLNELYYVFADDDLNTYSFGYKYYTAADADTYSDGYYSDAGSYYSVRKHNSSGTLLWESNIIIGAIEALALDLDQEFLYVCTLYTSGAIRKFYCSNGEEYTDTNWPIDITDSFDSIEEDTFIIGRDNKLYFFLYDFSDSSKPKLYKYDLDGTTATNWSTPYELPQHANGTSPWDIDVNSSGDIAIGARKIGEGGDAIWKVTSSKTLSFSGQLPSGQNAYGAEQVLMCDDGDIIAFSYDGADYRIHRITGETSGIVDTDWTKLEDSTTGAGMLRQAWWEAEGDDYFYHKAFGQTYDGFVKSSATDGDVEWMFLGDSDTSIEMAGVAQRKVAAWNITVTFGTNGEVKTYTGGEVANSGSALTSGDVVLAEAGKDFSFMFNPDTGYYVDEVTVDSTNLGYRSEYTFTNVLNNHTIHVTFGTGFPSGPFTYQYSMTGGILDIFDVGASFSESYALREPVLWWFIGAGPHQETYAITGEGYLPFDISLLYLINKHRSDNSVASVVEDPRGWLLEGAEYAVADMIANGSLTLTLVQIMGEDGANYPYLYAGAIPTIASSTFTPQQIFNAWIADGPTEAIILDEDYEEIAIYVEEDGGDNHIFVLFAQWHPQYTVERMTENLDTPLSLATTYFFDFLSPDEYQRLLDNASPVKLPQYSASVGDYELTGLISFNYRLEVGTPSYLTLTCRFSYDIFEEINARKDDGMSIESVFVSSGQEIRNEVISVEFSEVEVIAGESPKLSLSGYADLQYYNTTVPLRNVMTRTKDEQGKTRFRCSQPDFYLRPGCIATYESYSITVEKIVITVTNGLTQYMDITGE